MFSVLDYPPVFDLVLELEAQDREMGGKPLVPTSLSSASQSCDGTGWSSAEGEH